MYKKSFQMLAVVTFIMSWSGVAMAEPQITSRTEYYDVRGATKDAIRQDMRRRCPGGGGFYGFTKWNSLHGYNTQPTAGGCVGTDMYLKMDIVVYLPRLVEGPNNKEWKNFVKKLALHEEGHRKLAVEAAHAMDKRMHEAAAAVGDCRRLGSAINNAANMTAAEYRRKDNQYDQETQHGKTQGANF